MFQSNGAKWLDAIDRAVISTVSGLGTLDRLKFNFVMGNGNIGLTWDTGIASAISGNGLDATHDDATNQLLTTYIWGI